MIVNIHEAKTQLSQLLKRVALGDTVVIARDGMPVAKLMPITAEVTQRTPELAKGLWSYAEDWDSEETNALVAGLLSGEDLAETQQPSRRKRRVKPQAASAKPRSK